MLLLLLLLLLLLFFFLLFCFNGLKMTMPPELLTKVGNPITELRYRANKRQSLLFGENKKFEHCKI